MKILVTGAEGFIGKNLIYTCIKKGYDVFSYDRSNSDEELCNYVKNADFVVHLAGINRPLTSEEFYDGNVNFTTKLLTLLEKENRNIPLLLSSSIHAASNNDYGKSKKMAEDAVFDYGKRTSSKVYVFRLANAFGKWCKPNYNSVVATFCHNIANDLDIQVNDASVVIPFVYIDDIVERFLMCIDEDQCDHVLSVEPIYEVSIGKLIDLIKSFKQCRTTFMIPNMDNGFEKKLYSTYLSYLNTNDFKYPLKMNCDERGSFSEFLKTNDRGQVSINVAKPGIVKGNHWHHSKNEKFLVVSGRGIIRFRKMGDSTIFEYLVSSEKFEVIDIPTGYTHNIENLGDTDMVTVMWCNEIFDGSKPDTFAEIV